MFRFLLRALGFWLAAAGFVGLVVDGTRAIANGAIVLTTLDGFARAVAPASVPLWEGWVRSHIAALAWDPILVQVLRLPAGPFFFVLGILLLWLGRKPARSPDWLAQG